MRNIVSIFIIIIFFPIAPISQNIMKELSEKITAVLFQDNEHITLDKYKNLSLSEVRTFISIVDLSPPSINGDTSLKNLFLYYNSDTIDLNSQNKYTLFKKLDFSGDGLDDLVLSAHLGDEEKHLYLWQNVINKYRFIAATSGNVTKIIFNEDLNNPCTFIIVSDLCCASYVGTAKVFSPSLKDNRLTYSITDKYKFFVYESWEFPVDYKFITKQRFYIQDDSCRLRYTPKIMNDYHESLSSFEGITVYGNIIAEFVKGSKGIAIAEKIDADKNVWWFAIMDIDCDTYYNRFYNEENSHKCGWLNKKDLTILQ